MLSDLLNTIMASYSLGSDANVTAAYFNIDVNEVLQKYLKGELDEKEIRASASEARKTNLKDALKKKDEDTIRIDVTPFPVLPPAMRPAEVEKYVRTELSKWFTVCPPNTDYRYALADRNKQANQVAYVNILTFNLVKPDAVCWSMAQDNRLPVDVLKRNQLKLIDADKYFACNGSQQGLFNRLKVGFNLNVSREGTIGHRRVTLDLNQVLPWEKVFPNQNPTSPLPTIGIPVKINSMSDMGMPYNCEGTGKDRRALKMTDEVTIYDEEWKSLGKVQGLVAMMHEFRIFMRFAKGTSASISAALTDNLFRPRITYLLKSKQEIIKREKLLTKSRPYYNQPLGMKLAYQYVFSYVRCSWLPFWKSNDINDSVNMLGFSWAFDGESNGCQKIFRWAEGIKSGKAKALVYGDDLVVAVRLTDGELVWFFPDMDCMDMSQPESVIESAIERLIAQIQTVESCPLIIVRLLQLYPALCVNAYLNLTGPLLVRKRKGNTSGTAGTTELNQIISAANWYDHGKCFESCANYEEARNAMLSFAAASRSYGLQVGADTMDLQTLNDKQDGVALHGPILGMSIIRKDGVFYPTHSNPTRFWASLMYPTMFLKEETERSSHRGLRAVGIVLSGGWYDDDLYELCRKVYEASSDQVDVGKLAEVLMNDNEGDGTSKVVEAFVKMKHANFPSKNLIRSIYDGRDVVFESAFKAKEEAVADVVVKIDEIKFEEEPIVGLDKITIKHSATRVGLMANMLPLPEVATVKVVVDEINFDEETKVKDRELERKKGSRAKAKVTRFVERSAEELQTLKTEYQQVVKSFGITREESEKLKAERYDLETRLQVGLAEGTLSTREEQEIDRRVDQIVEVLETYRTKKRLAAQIALEIEECE